MQVQGKVEGIFEDKINGKNGEFTMYKIQVNGKKYATTHAPKVSKGDSVSFGAEEKVNGKYVNYSIVTGITKEAAEQSEAPARATASSAKYTAPTDDRQVSITRQSAFNYVTSLAAELIKKEAKDQSGLINTVAVIATISEPLAAYFIDGDKSQLKKSLASISPADALPF